MRSVAVIVACALAGAAHAQSFQTALPLSPEDRQAMEVQLGAFLDFARTGAVQQVALPSGQNMTMRAYDPVLQPGAQPCRGYRLDVAGPNGVTAVDGFRCRRTDGRAWAIVEPETVISQSGPLDLRGTGTPAQPQAADSQPLYGENDDSGPQIARTPPPVPRPSPRPRDTAPTVAALPDVPLTAPSVSEPVTPAPDTNSEFLSAARGALDPTTDASPPLPETETVVERITDTAASDASAAVSSVTDEITPVTDEVESIVTAALPDPEGVVERIDDAAAAAEASVRQVVGDERPEDTASSDAPESATSDRIVEALAGLDYLPEGDNPSSAAVRAAISDFARDERFTLPVAPWELEERLTAALDRSETLPPCGGGATPLCAADSAQ